MSITAIIEKHAGFDNANEVIWLVDSTVSWDTSQTARFAMRLARSISRPVRVLWVDEMGGERVFNGSAEIAAKIEAERHSKAIALSLAVIAEFKAANAERRAMRDVLATPSI